MRRANDTFGTGLELRLSQWANDWITAHPADGSVSLGGGVFSPVELRCSTQEEIDQFNASRTDRNVGTFWREWEMDSKGRFTRRS